MVGHTFRGIKCPIVRVASLCKTKSCPFCIKTTITTPEGIVSFWTFFSFDKGSLNRHTVSIYVLIDIFMFL